MFRILAISALSLFTISAASAQTRATTKPVYDDWSVPSGIWDTATPAAATAAPAPTVAQAQADVAASRIHTDDVAYAAPGMAVHINRNPKLLPYSVRPARKHKTTTSANSMAVATR